MLVDGGCEVAADKKVLNQYVLIKWLGEGGAANVWSAVDVDKGDEVALKSYRKRQQLEREIKFLRELNHPVVRVA